MKEKTKKKWKKVGRKVAKIGSALLGTAIGGPAGTAIGGIVGSALGVDGNDPDAVMKALETDTNAAVKLSEIEAKHKEELERISLGYAQAEVEKLKAVNITMQAEAESDKWWVSGWRPFIGFTFGLTLFCVYFLIPLAGLIVTIFKPEFTFEIPIIPVTVFTMWGAILGVATWDRGKEKRIKQGEEYEGLGGLLRKGN